MSKIDLLDASPADLADAAKSPASQAFVDQLRRRAADVAGMAKQRAADFTSFARGRAGEEVGRRRSSAADALENLIEVIRPPADHRVRRNRKLALVGGSGLALTAAVGLGVAVGFVLSRQLKKKAVERQGGGFASSPASSPAAEPRVGLEDDRFGMSA